ncbi:hypothetical protein PF011_g4796 [Phytophthora fragariae]|uniref:Uncharacterized protein n=2 Tax=Phytophthora fragariae TaxID=53985 RepID=A0A6A3LUA2_9STRA|nr:hypothetical protein PF011_g4796 [Phytophthora fragariae]
MLSLSGGLRLAQTESLELLTLLVPYGGGTWLELMAAGSVHTPIRPLISATGFNPIAYACANSERDSRFPVGGILQLVALLRLLVLIMTERGDRCTVEEAMCILMYRLNYHRRLHNMERKLRWEA